MKTNIFQKIQNLLVLVVLLGELYACSNDKYEVIDNAVYVSEATKDILQKIMVDDKGGLATVSIRSNQKVGADVTVQLGIDKSLLDNYNNKMGTNYEMLPTEYYKLSSLSSNIKTGTAISSIGLQIKPLPENIVSSGKKYAIPVAITSVDGGMTILESAKGVVYALDQVVVTSVPTFGRVDGKTAIGVFHMRKEDYDLSAWSFEMRLNMSRLGDKGVIGSDQNQCIWDVGIPEGYTAGDGGVFIRFGASNLLGNVLQVKLQGGNPQIEANTAFNAKEWYHLAFVNDGSKFYIYVNGELDSSIDTQGKNFHFGGTFKLARNADKGYFVAEAMVSEVRFWTKAITQQQIKDNMFAIDPNTEGLEAYWKLNEGEGYTFRDATGHGNDGDMGDNYSVKWVHGIRSDEK